MTKLKFRGTNGGDKVAPDIQARLKALQEKQDAILANRGRREPAAIIKENATWEWHEMAATDAAPAEWVLRSEPLKWLNPEQPSVPLQSTYALKAALEKQKATFTIERGPNGSDLATQNDVRFVISNREPHIFAAKGQMTANDIAKLVGVDESKPLAKAPSVATTSIASHLLRGPKTCYTDPEMGAHRDAVLAERAAAETGPKGGIA